jgi:hypothetical protein
LRRELHDTQNVSPQHRAGRCRIWPINRREIENLGFETIDSGEKRGMMTAIDLKAARSVLLVALIVAASHTENDMTDVSRAEARL